MANYFGKTLKEVREDRGLTQSELSKLIQVTSRQIQRYEDDQIPPFLKVLALNKALDYNFIPLMGGDKQSHVSEPEAPYNSIKKPTSDVNEEGLMFVPISAQASYPEKRTEKLFLDNLEKVYIPNFPYKGNRYRIFEVSGPSMEPTFLEGYHVIVEQIPNDQFDQIANYYAYVVVMESNILLKRIFKKSDDEFVMISDNEEYHPQFILKRDEIKELWIVKRKMDWQMAPPKRFEIKV